jgi:hypothetical protein
MKKNRVFLLLCTEFNTASSAAPQIPPSRRMLGKTASPFLLTTIDANEITADDEELVGGDILGADHGEGGHDAHHVVDEESPLTAKPVGDPASDKAAAHPAFQVTPSRSILLACKSLRAVLRIRIWDPVPF